MGIQGLIPFLEKASRRVNIAEYSGCCVAIDAYCWLHKGTFSCVEKLARGEKCNAYVQYCMKFVNMLLAHNIKPILVFDGRHLPAKAATEKKRRESREFSRKKAAELLRAGRVNEARNHLRRCIDVTHDMALALIQECRSKNVDCIVAPYEADAQLAFLSMKNIAQIVITEDSDLVLFGCSKILFKMDIAGNGLLVEKEKLCLTMNMQPEQFTFEKFRYMCILSGCDYLQSLPGIGLGKACKFVARLLDDDICKALVRLPTSLNMKNLIVPESYKNDFLKADSAFQYQLVFDPQKRQLVHLTEPEDPLNLGDYVGKMLPPDTAYQLALGNLDPFTLNKVDNYDPDNTNAEGAGVPHSSIWAKDGGYKPPTNLRRVAPAFEMHQPSTKGKVVELSSKCLLTPKKRNLEETKEDYTEADMESMYSSKIQCIETAEKENSPQKSPNAESKVTSPVLSSDKKRHHIPFLKQQQPKEKQQMSNSVRTTPGALNKFCRIRRTEINKSVIVQSRFFCNRLNTENKEQGSESKPPTVLPSVNEKPKKKSSTFTSSLQSFEWNHELAPSEQEDASYATDVKREFKNPVKEIQGDTCPSNGEMYTEKNEEAETLSPDSGIEMTSKTDVEGAEDDVNIVHMEQMNKEEDKECSSPNTCRRPGLSKTKKQMTLLAMFGFQKKAKLQHS